jgi:sulfur carrier protein
VISVNGREVELPRPGATIADVLAGLDLDPEARGIAVAVDAEVVARGGWPTYALADGARLEIVHAVQGG